MRFKDYIKKVAQLHNISFTDKFGIKHEVIKDQANKQVIPVDEEFKVGDLRSILHSGGFQRGYGPSRYRRGESAGYIITHAKDKPWVSTIGRNSHHLIHVSSSYDSDNQKWNEDNQLWGIKRISKHLLKNNINHEISRDENGRHTIYVPVDQS